VASLPAGLPSLEELIERARAPGAARPEAEALIAGLALPLDSQQSPRQRADLLLSLIEDAHLGSFTNKKGRTVRTAAVQALLALGYPYALEVPPEALEAGREERPARSDSSRWGRLSARNYIGLVLVCLFGAAELVPVFWFSDLSSNDEFERWVIAIICATTFLPGLLAVLGHKLRLGFLKGLGSFILVLASLPWLLGGFASLFNLWSLIPFCIGGLFLFAMTLLHSEDP
jgi:hypothetical protein